MNIYCVINIGSSLTEEVLNLLFDSAQEVLSTRGKKCRLNLKSINLKGQLQTENKVGFMGSVTGIVFTAEFDWKDGYTKMNFIVKPVRRDTDLNTRNWSQAPLFPAGELDPKRN